jgi:hypothetical protein
MKHCLKKMEHNLKAGMTEGMMLFLMISGTFAFVFGIAIFASYNEMNTFNKFRGEGVPEATLTDALWSELRIEADGK